MSCGFLQAGIAGECWILIGPPSLGNLSGPRFDADRCRNVDPIGGMTGVEKGMSTPDAHVYVRVFVESAAARGRGGISNDLRFSDGNALRAESFRDSSRPEGGDYGVGP